jgi:hypothetical protein
LKGRWVKPEVREAVVERIDYGIRRVGMPLKGLLRLLGLAPGNYTTTGNVVKASLTGLMVRSRAVMGCSRGSAKRLWPRIPCIAAWTKYLRIRRRSLGICGSVGRTVKFEVLLYDLTSTYFESSPPGSDEDKRRFGLRGIIGPIVSKW